jgi:hypothetical protein
LNLGLVDLVGLISLLEDGFSEKVTAFIIRAI